VQRRKALKSLVLQTKVITRHKGVKQRQRKYASTKALVVALRKEKGIVASRTTVTRDLNALG
jgi:hypothetical protein